MSAVIERLALSPDLSEIARLNAWLRDTLAGAPVSDALRGDLQLCLNEAVTNVISYAFDDTPAPELQVALETGPGWVRATVTDNGAPFDPLAAPPAPPMDGLDTARIGGFGIKLLRETASGLAYARADGRNRLTIDCRETA